MNNIIKLIIEENVYEIMKKLTHKYDEEISWMCATELKENGDIYINDVFIFPQECSGVYTEFNRRAYPNFLKVYGSKECFKLNGWFHSHVNMDVTPSYIDMNQFDNVYGKRDHFIMGILNKKDDMSIKISYNKPYDCSFTHRKRICKIVYDNPRIVIKKSDDKKIPDLNYDHILACYVRRISGRRYFSIWQWGYSKFGEDLDAYLPISLYNPDKFGQINLKGDSIACLG